VLAHRGRSRWPAAALAAGLLLASGTTAGYVMTRPPGHVYGTVPATRPPGPRSSAATGRQDRAGPRHQPADRSQAARPAGPTVIRVPALVRIPAIGVSTRVIPVGVDADGGLQIPADPSLIGWWAGGSGPGQPSGAVILTGHIDSATYGPGALFHLAAVRPGDAVIIRAGGRAYRYVVRALRAYPKGRLPAALIFSQQVTPRLVIISCGGPFDAVTGHYLDNLVAYALPQPSGR
jgi:hypothetical protein